MFYKIKNHSNFMKFSGVINKPISDFIGDKAFEIHQSGFGCVTSIKFSDANVWLTPSEAGIDVGMWFTNGEVDRDLIKVEVKVEEPNYFVVSQAVTVNQVKLMTKDEAEARCIKLSTEHPNGEFFVAKRVSVPVSTVKIVMETVK